MQKKSHSRSINREYTNQILQERAPVNMRKEAEFLHEQSAFLPFHTSQQHILLHPQFPGKKDYQKEATSIATHHNLPIWWNLY
jgi:hypothetical protein